MAISQFIKECPQCRTSYATTDKRQKYCSMSCRGKSRKSDDRARLMAKVERAPGCWRWTGCVNNKGYGIMLNRAWTQVGSSADVRVVRGTDSEGQ